jgi:hypothetical protein
MGWRKLLQVLRSHPYSSGALVGVPLSVVVWMLLVNRHPLGLLFIALWVAFGSLWFRSPIYRMMVVAWFVSTMLALVFWQYSLSKLH